MAGRARPQGWWLLLPVVDLVLLIVLGHVIGTGWAILLWLAGVIAGLAVIRFGARRAWSAMRDSRRNATSPGSGAAAGVGLLVAGLLLAMPGPLTDVAGIALLVPAVRRRVGNAVAARFVTRTMRGAPGTVPPLRVRARRGPGVSGPGTVIDGEVRR